jgi:glycine/sarcosine N-methyltransferase
MPFYQSIAPYYDYIFPPSEAQVAFVSGQLGSLNARSILEAGCGTGNLALALAHRRAIVEGIDLDEEMIDRAMEKSHRRDQLNFRTLNILNLSQEWPSSFFDAVVSFGNTLVHLPGVNKVMDFFAESRKVLKPGGRLMVQIINYDRILDNKIKGLATIENDDICFERYYDITNPGEIIDFRTVLTVKKTGEVMQNVVALYPLRKKEIEAALQEVGFDDVHFFGSFTGDVMTENSVPLIFTAKA